MTKNSANSLNSNQERRLSVTCRYIDKLLGDMETSLNVSASKSAFPLYAPDVSSVQREIVEDYISRIRAQLVKVLDSHGVARPTSDIPVSRSLRANLAFINIAVEELNPEYMKGYGEVSPAAAAELRQISAELQVLATQLDRYLAHELRDNSSDRGENIEKC